MVRFSQHFQDQNSDLVTVTAFGHWFLGHPMLMIQTSSVELIHKWLTDDSVSLKSGILKIICEYLKMQTKDTVTHRAKVDVETLIGNASHFAESGIVNGLVQTHLDAILQCCLDIRAGVAKLAVEAIASSLEQGLLNPLLVLELI